MTRPLVIVVGIVVFVLVRRWAWRRLELELEQQYRRTARAERSRRGIPELEPDRCVYCRARVERSTTGAPILWVVDDRTWPIAGGCPGHALPEAAS